VNLVTEERTRPDVPAAIGQQRPDDPDSRADAVHNLWELHHGPLAGWCTAMVGNQDDAHDIASESFTRLLSSWLRVRDPRGFLYVTATNLARDGWRREKRQRQLESRLAIATPSVVPATDTCLRDLVERLPDRMRAPVILYYYADMSVAEVAAALHRPEGTIRRTLSDARANLLASVQDDVS
jgi:RNA polymerase sigma-70 factor (ECF subfamily)